MTDNKINESSRRAPDKPVTLTRERIQIIRDRHECCRPGTISNEDCETVVALCDAALRAGELQTFVQDIADTACVFVAPSGESCQCLCCAARRLLERNPHG